MTEQEYQSLKNGDIVTQNSQYFLVCENIEDGFIDTEELSDIGKKSEFGFNHTNINYQYADIVYNQHIINAINSWLECNEEYEPYSYIKGFIDALE